MNAEDQMARAMMICVGCGLLAVLGIVGGLVALVVHFL